MVVEIEVMHDAHAQPQRFLGLDQVTQIGPAVAGPADRAAASFFNGPLVQLITGVSDMDRTLVGVQVAVASVPAGIYTVKEIHASVHSLQDILGRTDAHQIGGLVFGQVGRDRLDDGIHLFMGFPHRQAADGVAVQIHVADLLRVADPDIMINGSLVDAEQELMAVDGILPLIQPGQFLPAALQPPGRTVYGICYILPVRQGRRTFVKGHGNGRAQVGLDLHALFRSHEDLGPVNMGTEPDAFLLDFTQLRQRKDLEAARIRQDGPVPSHEVMQSAQLMDGPVSRPDMQMVGIAEGDLGIYGPEVTGRQASLDGGRCGHIHKDRCLDGAVDRFHPGPLGHPFLFQ